MSATEVIEQIKQLPREERARVIAFVKDIPTEGIKDESRVRYIDPAKAEAISERLFEKHAELFRRLAS